MIQNYDNDQVTFIDQNFTNSMRLFFPQASYCILLPSKKIKQPLTTEEWLTENDLNYDQQNQSDDKSLDNLEQKILTVIENQVGKLYTGNDCLDEFRLVGLYLLAAYSTGWDISGALEDLNCWAIAQDRMDQTKPNVLGSIVSLLDDRLIQCARPIVDKQAQNHAFVNTLTLAIIELAKTSQAILPSAYFLFLQKYDPVLVLLLNGWGRKEPWIETVGIVHHHFCEQTLKKPLNKLFLTPVVDVVLDFFLYD